MGLFSMRWTMTSAAGGCAPGRPRHTRPEGGGSCRVRVRISVRGIGHKAPPLSEDPSPLTQLEQEVGGLMFAAQSFSRLSTYSWGYFSWRCARCARCGVDQLSHAPLQEIVWCGAPPSCRYCRDFPNPAAQPTFSKGAGHVFLPVEVVGHLPVGVRVSPRVGEHGVHILCPWGGQGSPRAVPIGREPFLRAGVDGHILRIQPQDWSRGGAEALRGVSLGQPAMRSMFTQGMPEARTSSKERRMSAAGGPAHGGRTASCMV